MPLIELSRTFPQYNELMWNYENPENVARFLLHRSNQPAGTYAVVGNIPNVPGGSNSDYSSKLNAGDYTKRPMKIYHRDYKTEVLGVIDNTWYYKLQRFDHNGTVLADDAVLANIAPRTILSYEELKASTPPSHMLRNLRHHREQISVPASRTFAANPYIYDFRKLFGARAINLRMRSIGTALPVRLNNVNNVSITVPIIAAPGWDDVNDDNSGAAALHRILFENSTGAPIAFDLDFNLEA